METIQFEAALSVIGGLRKVVEDLGIGARSCTLTIKVIDQADLARRHSTQVGKRIPDEGLYFYHGCGALTELLEPTGHDLAGSLFANQRVDTMSHLLLAVPTPGNAWTISVLVPKKPNGVGEHIRQVLREAERALEKEYRQ